ncbi:MAG TPA: hypothetical protein VGF38_19370 [Ktedonobacterales bacterium]|jgi:hypothetical protein
MAATPLDRKDILHAIERWPVEDQVALARTILERAASGQPVTGLEKPPRSTWDALHGIASDGREPPTDEQVAQWLDEHKTDKYGR